MTAGTYPETQGKNWVCSALKTRCGEVLGLFAMGRHREVEPGFSQRFAAVGGEATGARWSVKNSDFMQEKLLHHQGHQRLKCCPEKL